ncbi:MAG: cyclase [Verrucomicrobia bacterium]|nr:MAG: cyclase [Verrucomicrobiota bacterium]
MKLATRPTVFPTLTRLPVAPIKTNNRRKSIIHLLVRSNVSDFARWKPVYDAHLSARQKAGLKEEHLFRNADVSNEVLPFTVEDFDRAKAFTASDDLRQAMERAGVSDKPDFYFLK